MTEGCHLSVYVGPRLLARGSRNAIREACCCHCPLWWQVGYVPPSKVPSPAFGGGRMPVGGWQCICRVRSSGLKDLVTRMFLLHQTDPMLFHPVSDAQTPRGHCAPAFSGAVAEGMEACSVVRFCYRLLEEQVRPGPSSSFNGTSHFSKDSQASRWQQTGVPQSDSLAPATAGPFSHFYH